jgi:hypothetical protein
MSRCRFSIFPADRGVVVKIRPKSLFWPQVLFKFFYDNNSTNIYDGISTSVRSLTPNHGSGILNPGKSKFLSFGCSKNNALPESLHFGNHEPLCDYDDSGWLERLAWFVAVLNFIAVKFPLYDIVKFF